MKNTEVAVVTVTPVAADGLPTKLPEGQQASVSLDKPELGTLEATDTAGVYFLKPTPGASGSVVVKVSAVVKGQEITGSSDAIEITSEQQPPVERDAVGFQVKVEVQPAAQAAK